MNKGDLVAKIQDEAGLTKAQAESALSAVLDGISGALKGGESVSMIGFGTFSINERPAREGRNPRTGETIKIAAKNVVKFKAGKGLNETVN
ncbi:MAG: HU family DNA-binding protein [Bacteroidota bacterium]